MGFLLVQVKVSREGGEIKEEVEGEDQWKEKEARQKEEQPPPKKAKINRYMGFKEDPFIYLTVRIQIINKDKNCLGISSEIFFIFYKLYLDNC